MVLIYSEETTPRLKYICELIFRDILNSACTLTNDSSVYLQSYLPKICYASLKTGDGLFLKASDLLFNKQNNIINLEPVVAYGETGFFSTSVDSFLPFDPLASAFMVVSRMEEYQPGENDEHGRFQAQNSILYKYNLLKKPMVNRWAWLLASKLEEKYPSLRFVKGSMQFLSTIDIDNAWAYFHKGFFRTAGGFLKDLSKFNFPEIHRRSCVLSGKINDPYDTYDYLLHIFKGNEDKVRFFFLMGNYGRFDKSVSWKNKAFGSLLKKMAGIFSVGIHPSYRFAASEDAALLVAETGRLEKITGKKITLGRQHYLKIRMPATYQLWQSAGIADDYSMGFHNQNGFRAGMCTPFYFYDLSCEVVTSVRIIPFQIMDVTLLQYMKLTPEEAIGEIGNLMQEVKNVGGLFVGIWHNESVADDGKWNGYRKVFEFMNTKGFAYASE